MSNKDIFPRRNLPGSANNWGREVEDRIYSLESGVDGQKTNLKSENRASASTLQELARQIVQVRENTEALANAIKAIPKPYLSQNSAEAFTLTSGWNTVVETSIVIPEDVTNMSLVVYGSGQIVSETTTQNVETSYRIVVPGIGESPPAPGPWSLGYGDFRTVLVPSYGWTATVFPGQTITAQFQISAEDPGAYSTPNANSYAVITLDAALTGSSIALAPGDG